MASILKVNTIQDTDGNNIINENANVITIGASGDTITVPAGATVSGFTSAGIDDNADAISVTIDSSERVLIKTTDIGYSGFGDTLTIGSASGNNGMTLRSGTSNYGTFYFSDDTGTSAGTYAGKIQYNHSNNSMVFATNSSDRMTISSAGSVGIAETAPLGKLHVKVSDSGVTSLNSAASGLFIESADSTGMTIASGTTNVGRLVFTDNSNDLRGMVEYNHSNDAMRFYSGGGERLRILSDGKVGINNSAPSTELEVYGTIKAHEKSGLAQASILIDALATGNPHLAFQQAGTYKGYIHYLDASDTICLNDGSGN